MNILEHVRLAEYTTLKIGGPARFFCNVTNEDELYEAVTFAHNKKLQIFILGGGSNILMNDAGFDGLVIKMEIMGIEFDNKIGSDVSAKSDIENVTDSVVVSVGAGEQWDFFVEKVVERNLYGVENLSAIPGTVGASPVQNIGAYGSEASQTITKVRVLDMDTMNFLDISNIDCDFSYRESLFKKNKGKYVITRVYFILLKKGKINIEYKELSDYFSKKGITNPNLKEVRDAVIDIRWAKLPDWKLWGTAGSFFKNPIISADKFMILKKIYPELPGFSETDGRVKISLGWILDKVCHVNGMSKGNVGVYEKQALVLVTKPGATAEEVVSLANDLTAMVKEKTGIDIEGEVEWVN